MNAFFVEMVDCRTMHAHLRCPEHERLTTGFNNRPDIPNLAHILIQVYKVRNVGVELQSNYHIMLIATVTIALSEENVTCTSSIPHLLSTSSGCFFAQGSSNNYAEWKVAKRLETAVHGFVRCICPEEGRLTT